MLPQNSYDNQTPQLRHEHENQPEPYLAKRARLQLPQTIALVAAGLLLISLTVQLLYPKQTALPLTKIAGESVSHQPLETITKNLERRLNNPKVRIKTPNQEITVPWSTLGITADAKTTATAAVRYEWWERLIPFSMAARMLFNANNDIVVRTDNDTLAKFAVGLIELDAKAPVEPKITLEDGAVSAKAGQNGYAFDRNKVIQQIKSTGFGEPVITLEPDEVAPKTSQQAIASMVSRIEQILRKDIALKFAGRNVSPEKKQIGSWLTVQPDASTGVLRVDASKAAIRAYLESVAKKYAKPPGTVTVTLLDGIEVARVSATTVKTMDVDKALPVVSAGLLDTRETVALDIPLEPVAPKEEIVRQYSRTESGLHTFLNDWTRVTGGELGIVVQEVGKAGRGASVNANKSFVPASTYKLFLAYVVLKKMDQGSIKEAQITKMGWRVDDCVVEMILKSTNECAVTLHTLVGWEEVDRVLRASGFKNTTLNNLKGGEKRTTPRDEATLLAKLHSCSFLSRKRCDYLLNIMRQQIYRTGIPAGVPSGIKVTNKVGFLGNYLHDIAIVYGPKTTYILVIMSHRYPPPDIPGLSKKIYEFFE